MAEKLIGREVEAYCGKCKSDTIHLITAAEAEKIAKVMCKTCMAYHNFRKPKGAETEKSKTKKASTDKKEPVKRRTRRDKWTRMLESTEAETTVEYNMSENYELETAINHKTFGIGVVKNIIDSRKIEVLFHDGQRTMVQNLIK